MNFGARVVNVPDHLIKMAALIEEAGVKPEIEYSIWGTCRAPLIETPGHSAGSVFRCQYASASVGRSLLPENLLQMKRYLPENARWSAFGISAPNFRWWRRA